MSVNRVTVRLTEADAARLNAVRGTFTHDGKVLSVSQGLRVALEIARRAAEHKMLTDAASPDQPVTLPDEPAVTLPEDPELLKVQDDDDHLRPADA